MSSFDEVYFLFMDTNECIVSLQIDLTSHIVRVLCTLKVENLGPDVASEILLTFPNSQAMKLANLKTLYNEGKGKGSSAFNLLVSEVHPEGAPQEITFFSVSLRDRLEKGKSLILTVLAIFTHTLQPFPDEITQGDIQLVLYQDSAYFLSPYVVKSQTLNIMLPGGRVESYTKHPNGRIVDSAIKYGPFENLPPFSYSPIAVHYENNSPFVVAQELVREIEVSHWGSIQVTEQYNLVHKGATNKGGFSRLDYQARAYMGGKSSLRRLTARLPPRAHSVYYRDDIGNISTSHLWGDSRKTQLEIEPRFPMFGGWRTSFTIGYGLPLEDFLFVLEGRRFLNITLGSPVDEVVIDDLIVKVILPEGSKDISVSVPFPTKQWQETKYLHLDLVGRPVVVLEKTNVVPEHNIYFQVYYSFNNLSLLREPLMLILGFLFLFIACIVHVHADLSISKSSASYIAKLQWDEVQATVQRVQNIINKCLSIHEKLETSLQDLYRTGDVQSCKVARKTADGLLKELSKELKPLTIFLQSSPQAAQIWPKVDELVAKEKEMQEKLMQKHSAIVDCFEKKHSGRDIESRVAPYQQKLIALKQEIDDLLDFIDEI
ncbi:Dolichyl-diphosphooligosaccharide--protein glycosyltransferase subunit 1A [Apostasia shenzhenica]|uniref:Dolichyl-diphosphooligosaccharide--protein glycosyltransferase subunit 1 n=1 Tax=Apostasia shenzhenica TaxID=1088818 RepID=A0A2I0AYN1_9ASPA|nr:Dolichyl-diphosphooligosaccharide--protein glycosyltransferase subunit 1A [Apostasia shenzhenica]